MDILDLFQRVRHFELKKAGRIVAGAGKELSMAKPTGLQGRGLPPIALSCSIKPM